MIPSLGTNAPTDTLPGVGLRQGGKARANLEMDRVACLDARRDDDAADGLTQLEAPAIDPRQSACRIHTERALELPTAGTKPKAFGACPEKRLCARQLVLGAAMTGIAL
jgi:hypothetical protein